MHREILAPIGDSTGTSGSGEPGEPSIIKPDGLFDPQRLPEHTWQKAFEYLGSLERDSNKFAELAFKLTAMNPDIKPTDIPNALDIWHIVYSDLTSGNVAEEDQDRIRPAGKISIARLAHAKVLFPNEFAGLGRDMDEMEKALLSKKERILELNNPELIAERRILTPDERISPLHFGGQVLRGKIPLDTKRYIAAVVRDLIPELSEAYPMTPDDHRRMDALLAKHEIDENWSEFIRLAFIRTAISNKMVFSRDFGMKFELPKQDRDIGQTSDAVEGETPKITLKINLLGRFRRKRGHNKNGEPSHQPA